MIVIVKKKNETKDNLFRKFSRSFKDEEIILDVSRKSFYKSPSIIKKEKQKERLKRLAKRRRSI